MADVVDSLPPLLTQEEYAAAEQFHDIRPDEQEAAFKAGWRTPWVLSNVRPLPSAVPYKHPSGAVKWVVLDDDVVRRIAAQSGNFEASDGPTGQDMAFPEAQGSGARAEAISAQISAQPAPRVASADPTPRSESGATRTVRLTGGNIRNDHIYVPLDFFPGDTIGGANKHDPAARMVRVSFSPGQTVETDVDGTKRILRARGAVRDFLIRAELEEGDAVMIERTAPYAYRFTRG